MKQIAATLLLCLASVTYIHAQATGTVYSLNIVGFQKVAVDDSDSPYIIASMPFNPDDPNINSVVGEQLTPGNSFSESDNILVWDTGIQQYKSFFRAGDVGMPEFNFKWIDKDSFQVTTNPISNGSAFWIRSRQSSNQVVVLVGDVVTDDIVTNNIVPGYQLCAYPYSAGILLNETAFTNGAVMGNSFSSSDNIMLWDSDTQQYKSLFLAGDVGMPEFNYKWIDKDSFTVYTNTLDSGKGFWYRHRGTGFDWVETRPYTID